MKTLTDKEVSRLIRQSADAAVADGVGHRRPVNALPGRPTTDHKVAFALGYVRDAAKGAIEEGATLSELMNAVEMAYYARRDA